MTKFEWRVKHAKNAALVPFEWFGIVLLLVIVLPLSRRVLFGFCDLFSAVFYFFDRSGRRQALENLRIVRGKKSDIAAIHAFDSHTAGYAPTVAERRIIRRSYRNMVRTVGYAVWTMIRAKARCAATGLVDGTCRRILGENRPVVTVSGHLGCWEILSQLAYLEGHRMMSVAKRIGTRGMTALLMRARRSIGQEIVSADGAFKPLMRGLRGGKSLGLLVDQRVAPEDGGIWIRFFGVPMAVSAAPAFFAAKGNVPIAVAWSHPLRDGRYRCEFVDEIPAADARDIWSTTQRCAHDLERIVRRHPSCWVLNYDYFSRRPGQEDLRILAERETKGMT